MESSKGIALTLQPGVQLSSTFAGHYDLAIYLAMLVIIFFTSFCLVKKNSWKILILTSDILAVWLFMRAGSRIGILALITALVVMSFLLRKLRFGAIFILIVLAMMFTSSNLLMRMNNLLNVLKNSSYSIIPSAMAIEDRAIQADRSTSIRLDVEWPNAIRALIKNPLLGTGYSSLGLATDNDYLRSLGETGLMGFTALALFLVGIGKGLIRSYRQKQNTIDQIIVTSTLGIFIFYLICAFFLDVFESSKIAILFWSYCGISFGIYSKKA
jgi:O-antigen ligase